MNNPQYNLLGVPSPIWIISILIGFALLFLRLPMLFLPSTDDMQALYATFVTQSDTQSWAAHPNVAQSRALIAAPLYILDLLKLPNFLLAVAAYFMNAFLLPILFALTLWTVKKELGYVSLFALTAFSSFHPGLAEAEHFWLIRFNLTFAYIAMIIFVVSWQRLIRWRFLSTCFMIACVGFSYQGYLNIALVILTALFASEIADEQKSNRKVLVSGITLAGGVISGILILAVSLKIVQHFGAAWVQYFEPLPIHLIPAKIVRVWQLYINVLVGDPGFPNKPLGTVILALAILSALIGVLFKFRLRRTVAVLFTVIGISLAALQLPSIPFHQQFYAMRSYPQIYLGLACLIALSFPAQPYAIPAIVRATTACAFAIFTLMSTVWVSAGFAVTRYYDFTNASRLVSLLDDSGFKWDKPIAVGFGGWNNWKYWVRGNTNAMEPILSATWSAHYLIGFVANRPIIKPTAEQQKVVEDYCLSTRKERPSPHVSDHGDVMALCL